jgi:RNA-directed DNA polymerase
VRANKGVAGVDGLDIDQTAAQLRTAWPAIREQLLSGTYRPSPVRRVAIPKPEGGERELGVPTVTDRLIQQALLQVLQPLLDPTFSEHSYGFRPGRGAHDAVLVAQSYVQSGRRIVVDVDLEKFFDRVDHDILIDRLQKRIGDGGVIQLIRAYLNSGIMDDGVVQRRTMGRHKAVLYRRCWPTSCSTKWTRRWNAGAIASCATPTMRTFTSAAAGRVSG